MDSLVVLLVYPVDAYLEQELDRRFRLIRLWDSPSPPDSLLRAHGSAIRAVVGYPGHKVDAALLDALPSLEIFSTFSVGLDHVDLAECRERGIRVTNTDVHTDDVADLAVGLAIAALRKIPQADRFVRAGLWKAKGDYTLTTRLKRAAPELTATERLILQEKEMLEDLFDLKPLVPVGQSTKGITYTEPLRTGWKPSLRLRHMPRARADKLRRRWHIFVEGDEVLPPARDFCDMISIAFTGSGKTLVFVLPLVMLALQEEMLHAHHVDVAKESTPTSPRQHTKPSKFSLKPPKLEQNH